VGPEKSFYFALQINHALLPKTHGNFAAEKIRKYNPISSCIDEAHQSFLANFAKLLKN